MNKLILFRGLNVLIKVSVLCKIWYYGQLVKEGIKDQVSKLGRHHGRMNLPLLTSQEGSYRLACCSCSSCLRMYTHALLSLRFSYIIQYTTYVLLEKQLA